MLERGCLMGFIIGLFAAIGMCVEAFDGRLEAWSIGAAIVIVLIGFIFPQTIGVALMTIVVASPIAIILALVTSNGASALSALGIGFTAFVGQYVIGIVRQDVSELRVPFRRNRGRNSRMSDAQTATMMVQFSIQEEMSELDEITVDAKARAVIISFINEVIPDSQTLFSNAATANPQRMAKTKNIIPELMSTAAYLVKASKQGHLYITPDGHGSRRYLAHLLGNQFALDFGLKRKVGTARGWADTAVIDGSMNAYVTAVQDMPEGSERRTWSLTVSTVTAGLWLSSPHRLRLPAK